MKKIDLVVTTLVGTCVSFFALPFSGQAQDAAASSAPVAVGGAAEGQADIVVSARKRDERLQQLPLTVSALTGAALASSGAHDVKDVLRAIPGISYSGVDRGLSNYNIRGIGTSANSPTVGIYLDDVALNTLSTSFSGAFDPAFFDMERLEVLKGPQGTLYGGSAMGGAIKYVSRRPSLVATTFDSALGVAGTHGGSPGYNGEGVVNIPLSPTIAVRGGFSYRHDGGYIDNVADGTVTYYKFAAANPPAAFSPAQRASLSGYSNDNYNDARTMVGRGSILWQPDSSLSVLAQAFYQDYRQANPTLGFPDQHGLIASYRIAQPTTDKDGIYSLQVQKSFASVQLTSLTAYYDRNIAYDRDYSYFIGGLIPSLYGLTSINSSVSKTHTYSQELRLSSDYGSASRFQWLVGAYASRQNDRLIQAVNTPGGEATLGGTTLGYYGNIQTITKQVAGFAELTYSLTDKLKLTAGGRVFYIHIYANSLGSGLLNGGVTSLARSSKESGVNPKAQVSYQATPDNLLYASATKGFRPGGPNRNNISSVVCGSALAELGLTAAPTDFGSDNLWTYELGSKNQFLGRAVTANASVYYTDWKKIQQQVSLSCGFAYTGNVGSADVKGAEIELSANPTRWLHIGGNATFADSRITATATGLTAQVGDGILGVPKWMANAYAAVDFPVGSLDGSFRVDYQYQGRARRQFERTLTTAYPDGTTGMIANPAQFRAGYQLVNLQVSVKHGAWDAQLYANNLFDVHPAFDVSTSLGALTESVIRPRTIGIQTHFHF
ncbi:TonB-dependent receptor [Sphingomonas oryzagri]|uniref:TonB-dependent receptor n=1 Tax=Sphingomonas oryzagri TaxID=3042314 RepID=A0ABT6MXA9_9SPHN|nr:TonB-dependent receptor [Sphingomonas oryzagri]MDH7637642.1 TonB-dependent receptor [Sphingomonas oryzagri]